MPVADLNTYSSGSVEAADPRAEHAAMLKAQQEDAERRVKAAYGEIERWSPIVHACAAGLEALAIAQRQDMPEPAR